MASNERMVFKDDTLIFPQAANKPRGPAAFSDNCGVTFAQAQAAELRRGLYCSPNHPGRDHHPQNRNWSAEADTGSDGDEEEGDDDDGEDDDIDEGDEVEGLVKNSKIHGEGSSMAKGGDCVRGHLTENHQEDRMGNYENALAVVEPESYCPRVFPGGEELGLARREVGGENDYGRGGRKDASSSCDPGESLRRHLSDPINGVLMDDAMILRCGHSFSSSGIQHIYRLKACYKCSQPISEDSARPNLSLRSAVQAFRREEEAHSSRASKRRRDRFEHEKCGYDDPPTESRGKGVQFPFVVSDRVIIKGNKRTPERFVGRMAVVTTQCQNGWYVVKTLDNAESVKVQYRSLAKVPQDSPSNMLTNKSVSPNWL